MKKQHSLLAWLANTPPMLLIVLFVLFSPTRSWASETATFGPYSGDVAFPANSTTDAINGVTLSSNMTLGSLNGSVYNFSADNTQYVDISLADGLIISNIETSILYDGRNAEVLYVVFCSTQAYDLEAIISPTPILLHESTASLASWGEWNNANPSFASISSVPENAKFARIYRNGTNTYGTYLYRIRVTVESDGSKEESELSIASSAVTIPVGGTFNLGVTTADGYDGEISYSISPNGIISRDGMVVTGEEMGIATVTVTASATATYAGASRTCTVNVVKNFAGDLAAVENDGTVSLNWFYNLPISLATEGDGVSNDWSNNGYHSSSYEAGVRTIRYYRNGDRGYACNDFKTPSVENCISFSFDYKGNNDNGTNPRIVPYSWVSGCDASLNYGDIVAAPVSITSEWQTATVTPAYYYAAGNINVQGSSMPFNYKDHPVGCVAFFPMADNSVADGTIQLRNAYFQLINTNGLTSSVALVRKDGSAPTNASDGVVRYTGAPTTFADNSGLVAGHTYYYRVFATYNGYTYASAPVSVTMPGAAKEDPELSLSESSAFMAIGDTYTLTPNKANEYDGIITYEITSGSAYVSLEGNVITATSAGTATITVTASETENYSGTSATFDVTVVALPETNLALDASGENVDVSWNIPGFVDLSTAKITPSSSFATNYSSFTYATSTDLNSNGVLEVTYSADGGGTITGFLFDVDLTSIETLSFDYKGDYAGSGWDGIFPGLYNSSNGTMYWEGGSHSLAETTWQSKNVTLTKGFWKGSDTYPSGNISELGFFANACDDAVSNGHMWVRNVRYHTTGMVDIDHIVIMRTTDAAATDTLSGTKLYSGRMFHYTDNALSSGIYYYTIFAVYEDGCFPVEYKTFDNRSFTITYKDQGNAEFSGVLADGSPTTHKGSATTNLKKASKDGYAFGGWYTAPACTGDAINVLDADAYDADITLYARWIEMNLHTPGTYEAPVSEGGYGRILKNKNSHDYEVYMVTYDAEGRQCMSGCDNKNGELYAGSITEIHDGYRMFSGAGNTKLQSADGWMAFKPYKYYGDDSSINTDEFQTLNTNSNIKSSRYARLGDNYYVHLYVQGYAEFAFAGQDNSTDGNNFVIRIDGISQAYTPNTSLHVTRFALTTNEPHFIEVTGSSSNTNNKFRGFSLQLPDVDRYTVTVAKNENSYGAVSAASIANVRTGSPVYVNGNLVYVAGDTITATPTESNAQYSYAFNNWTVGGAAVPATITAATTITANFTRTAEEYTLTWDLDGGTVTTAGTGAALDVTGTPSTTVAFSEIITAPVVEKEGSEFVGWNETPSPTMPAENTTYTAQWYAPYEITSAGIRLDASKVYPLSTPAPSLINFDADGNGVAELCLDIKNNGFAEWKAKIAKGYYMLTMVYGTPSAAVNVQVQIFDHLGVKQYETLVDVHSGSESLHYQSKLGLDLRDCDPDEIYTIKVVDVYDGTGSLPKVAYIDFAEITPTAISKGATTHLDNINVASPYKIENYDIENDGEAETCLSIGDQHQADWLVTIAPDVYNINIYYGRTSSTKLNLYILNSAGETVYTSEQRTTPSGNYEMWTIPAVDLTGYSDDEQYIVRIKDTYGANWSRPYIAYIDFIGKTVQIPAETRLDATNTYSTVNIRTDVNFDDDDLTSDESMKLDGTQADYVVQIQPGYYNVSLAYGAPEYSVRVAVTLTDPTGAEEERYLSTNPYYYESGSENVEHHHISSTKCDLTGLDGNKSYRLHITDEYGTSNNLRVSHLQFTPIEPVLIANNTILNSTNTVTFNAPTQEFNVDGEEGNETCLLVSQHYGVSPVEWSVNVTPGVYDLNVHFGNNAANDGGYDMTIYLVDPEEPESPVSLYHKRVNDGTSLSYGVARCDFSGLAADKDYIIRVVDNWNGSKLRVGDIKFVTPEPLQIPSVTRLNASNVYVTPHYGKQNFNIEGEGEIECLNIRYQGEAAWFANMTPYVYNITVKYGKASGSSKVRFGIIEVSTGDTIFVQQDDKGDVTEPTTYTAQANSIDLRSSITAGDLYKIFVKDNYPSLGSEPRVAYLDIERATVIHTRSNLRVGDFGTVCLPYAVVAADRVGAELFEVEEWDANGTSLTLSELTADEDMVAGRPYIYQATAGTATFRYYPEGALAAVADRDDCNGLTGSYTKEIITANDNNYIIYNNKLYMVNSLAYVGEYRAFIHRNVGGGYTPAPANRRRITMAVNGTAVATGLDQITNDQLRMTNKIIKDNQLFIIRDGKTYNAQGQLVNR